MLSNAECMASRRARVGGDVDTVASLQNSCEKATDIAKTRLALTRKAKASPMLILACCFDMGDPNTEPYDTGFPSRLW